MKSSCQQHCSACENPSAYCPSYIGPQYGAEGRRTIFFVGLDGGEDKGHLKPKTVEEWRNDVLTHYRIEKQSWRLHYRGCIQIAADLLGGMSCQNLCQEECAGYPSNLCALESFAQGNAVRCVKAGNEKMEFRQHQLIPYCLKLTVRELASLQPNVIILQSTDCLEDKFYGLLRQSSFGSFDKETGEPFDKEAETDYSGVFTWAVSATKSIIISTPHPSYSSYCGGFEAYMERYVHPRLQIVHNWFPKTPQSNGA